VSVSFYSTPIIALKSNYINYYAHSKWNVASEAVKDNREWEENGRGRRCFLLQTKNPANPPEADKLRGSCLNTLGGGYYSQFKHG